MACVVFAVGTANARYVQADPIGRDGGDNRFIYTYSNGLNFADPYGLETTITVWQGVGSASSAFGHVSSNVNGKNWSWGSDGWDRTYPSATGYDSRQQVFRGGTSFDLNLTPNEEAAYERCLSAGSDAYNAISNNCGNPVQRCLPSRLGLPGDKVLPRSLAGDFAKSPGLLGTRQRGTMRPPPFPYLGMPPFGF